MRENYFFAPAKSEIEQGKVVNEFEPLTAEKLEETEEDPMMLKDHWLSLRHSIQEKIILEKPAPEDQEKIKMLSELITPDLMKEYKQILQSFNSKARKTEEHAQREFVDVNNEEFSVSIDKWVKNLINEIKIKNKADFSESDIEELRAQCWLLFDSIVNVMNTRSLEKDINEFYENKIDEIDEKESAKKKSELIKQLQSRYPLDKAEMEILVDLVRSSKDGNEKYSPKILVETIHRLWGEYKLAEKKGVIAKISLGYLMSKGVESFAPSLFQNLFAQDKFHLWVFLEFLGLNKLSEVIDAKTEIELAKVMNEINHQINERITNSLFFQEFEFIHEKSLGEIYATMERGKNATEQILQDTISRFTPMLAGIAMSLAFLTKINPYLGAISVASLPAMYKIAKNQNKKIGPMYEKEMIEGEEIATRLGSIKSGFEEIKTSPETPRVAAHVREQMNIKDTLSLNRFIEETKNRLKSMIPFDISTAVSAGVGYALQENGMISGGAVLSNITYSNQLNSPVQQLVNLYFNNFYHCVRDIQRMDKVLGKYEKLDLPEGEKEKDRVSISKLKNFDISIENLRFKDILKDLNLDIEQGEFITIAGASGAGKSTLLRNLVGLYKPESGEIKIGGIKNDKLKKYGKDSIYYAMSYCNQNPQIFDRMTLRENLLLWSKDEVSDEKIRKVLFDLHLEKFVDKLDIELRNLSGGEKVRIGVARTLIKGAKIMLLDEPTASLDSQAATEVRKVISEINKKYPDTTIICVSHDEELIKISKRSVDIKDLQKGV